VLLPEAAVPGFALAVLDPFGAVPAVLATLEAGATAFVLPAPNVAELVTVVAGAAVLEPEAGLNNIWSVTACCNGR